MMEKWSKKEGEGAAVPVGKMLWTGDMVIRACGGGEPARYPGCRYPTYRLQWVSRTTGEVREPQETTRTYPAHLGFTAAGKQYQSISQLYAQHDERRTWCRDIYGREVLYLAERFPCFDSEDFLYEKRFYRFFFLREGEKLTRVQYTDESNTVTVTEDVANLERQWMEKFQSLGYFDTEIG